MTDEQDLIYEIIPDGYDWGTIPLNLFLLAMFSWDKEKSSKKLSIEDDQLTVKVKDGSGFKTSMGDTVSFT